MRLHVHQEKTPIHKDICTCLGWSGSNDLLSCSDDHTVHRWSMAGEPQAPLATIDAVFATALHWFPALSRRQGSQTTEVFLLGCADGSFRLISKSGRIEKTVEAHTGAVSDIKWNYEGTAIASAGEDGIVKIWSRAGMLRSTLASVGQCIYSLCWSPESDQVLFTSGTDLILKPVQASTKQTQWKAHDAPILRVDWSPVNQLILSAAEDGRYKIWDSFGRQSFTSKPFEFSWTSAAWCPDGESFAVGSFNHVRVCDKTGFSLCSVQLDAVGSVYSIAWTFDGTQLAFGCGNGAVCFGRIIDRSVEWHNIDARLTEPNTVRVRDLSSEGSEDLDFRDRVVKMSIGFQHLVVVTATQCAIYDVQNFHTPHMFDVRDPVSLLLQSETGLLIVDNFTGIQVLSYEGRPISNPKYPGLRSSEFLNAQNLSFSKDTIAVIDKSNPKMVTILEVSSGKPIKQVQHQLEILHIRLDQYGPSTLRKLAFIDRNHDLYIVRLGQSDTLKPIKLSPMVDTFMWCESADALAAVCDNKFIVWHYTNVLFIDRDLVNRTRMIREFGPDHFGRTPQLIDFSVSHCTVRRADGTRLAVPLHPCMRVLYSLVEQRRWDGAVRLCRFVKDSLLWACLAGMAMQEEQLNTAEDAYAAIDEVEKLQFILHVKELPTREGRSAELALFQRRPKEAESILLQANLMYRAIKLNIKLFDWERALELAVQNKVHVDTVLAYRKRYLDQTSRKESLAKFQQMFDKLGSNFDWKTIKEAINADKKKEMERK